MSSVALKHGLRSAPTRRSSLDSGNPSRKRGPSSHRTPPPRRRVVTARRSPLRQGAPREPLEARANPAPRARRKTRPRGARGPGRPKGATRTGPPAPFPGRTLAAVDRPRRSRRRTAGRPGRGDAGRRQEAPHRRAGAGEPPSATRPKKTPPRGAATTRTGRRVAATASRRDGRRPIIDIAPGAGRAHAHARGVGRDTTTAGGPRGPHAGRGRLVHRAATCSGPSSGRGTWWTWPRTAGRPSRGADAAVRLRLPGHRDAGHERVPVRPGHPAVGARRAGAEAVHLRADEHAQPDERELGLGMADVEIKIYGAFVLNHRVVLHAIDATPARRRGGVFCRRPSQTHPTHWLISTQASA